MTRDYIEHDLPMVEGWALYVYAMLTDSWANVKMGSPGYIAQEIDRLMTLAKQ